MRPPRNASVELDTPRWGPIGIDGWPQLVVSCSGATTVPEFLQGGGGTFLLSAGSGQLQSTIPGIRDVAITDADYNGVSDIGKEPTDRSGPVAGKDAQVISGSPLERWRRIGTCHAGDDYDGDGMADCLAMATPDSSGNSRPYAAISSADGRPLWHFEPKLMQLVNPRFIPLRADINDDATPDLLAIINGRDDGPVIAISGRDGQQLWTTRELRPSNSKESWIADRAHEMVDVDGDGRAEIVLTYAVRTDRGWNDSTDSPDIVFQSWFIVLSARDGSVLWKISMAEEMADTFTSPAWTGDLNGDTFPDFVLWSVASSQMHQETRTGGDATALVAIGGRDGRILWKWPLPAGATLPFVDNGDTVLSETRPEAGDLNGDGVPDVLLTFRPAAAVGDAADAIKDRFEVLALDGRNGQTLWNWHSPDTNYYRGTSAPRIVRLHNRPHVLVTTLLKFDDFLRSIAVLRDADGQLLQPINPEDPATAARYFEEDSVMHVWSVNLDGVGDDEVLIQYPSELVAMRGGVDLSKPEQVMWRFPLSKDQVLAAYPDRIEELGSAADAGHVAEAENYARNRYPGDAKQQAEAIAGWRDALQVTRAELVKRLDESLTTEHLNQYGYRIRILGGADSGVPITVAVTRFDGLIGLDGASGQPIWCCDGSDAPFVAILGPHDHSAPPAVLYPREHRTNYSGVICRQTLPAVLRNGRILLKPASAASELPTSQATAAEPTGFVPRSLPWVTDWHNGRSRWGLYAWLAGSSAPLTGLALIPLALAVWTVPRAVRSRTRRLSLTVLGFGGLAILMICVNLNGLALWVTFRWVLPIALSLLMLTISLVRFIWRQQWNRAGGVLLLTVVFALIAGLLWYWYDSRRIENWEFYTWDQWYVIGLLGIWFCGVALLFWEGAQQIRRWRCRQP